MPAQTNVKFQINIPPQGCKINLTPSAGVEFDT